MKEIIITNLGNTGLLIPAGIIILILFIVIRFFKFLLSSSFIGLILAIISYSIYDYIFMKIPLVAALAFVLCLTGFSKDGIFSKIFSLIGILLSGYVIIHTLGFI